MTSTIPPREFLLTAGGLDLFEQCKVRVDKFPRLCVLRIPGGFIYTQHFPNGQVTSVFVSHEQTYGESL